jgi:uncharacterized protein DUF2569
MSAGGAMRPEPHGLGGWLILLVLNILLMLAAYAYLASLALPLMRFELMRATTIGGKLWPFLYYGPDLVIGVALPIIVLVLFWRRHRAFPAACISFFALLIALGVFDYVIFIAANWSAWSRDGRLIIMPAIERPLVALAIHVALLAIWWTYLRRSARVASTFVK